jgi:hypothetical protein
MGVSAPLKLPRAVLSVALLASVSLYVFVLKFFNDAPPVAHDEPTALGMCVAATFCVRPPQPPPPPRRRPRPRTTVACSFTAPPFTYLTQHACSRARPRHALRLPRRMCWSSSTT